MGEGRVGFTIVTDVQQGMSLEVLATLCRSSLEDSSPISLNPPGNPDSFLSSGRRSGKKFAKGCCGLIPQVTS